MHVQAWCLDQPQQSRLDSSRGSHSAPSSQVRCRCPLAEAATEQLACLPTLVHALHTCHTGAPQRQDSAAAGIMLSGCRAQEPAHSGDWGVITLLHLDPACQVSRQACSALSCTSLVAPPWAAPLRCHDLGSVHECMPSARNLLEPRHLYRSVVPAVLAVHTLPSCRSAAGLFSRFLADWLLPLTSSACCHGCLVFLVHEGSWAGTTNAASTSASTASAHSAHQVLRLLMAVKLDRALCYVRYRSSRDSCQLAMHCLAQYPSSIAAGVQAACNQPYACAMNAELNGSMVSCMS